MEALLPSEIARLVFGYLEDQKCGEAARLFLEASPDLQECRTAVLSGRRFNTRVNGYTLVDIFDKFSAAHSLVQERLSKVGDCEQVRQCGDLLEQLRFLIGGSRGQRFVVNINVPSQTNSQTYGGSPVITSSIRKRHHSGSDRSKRTQKTLLQLFEKQPEQVSSQFGCDTVEATPLESLPGHTNFSITHQHEQTTTQDSDGVYCTSTKNDFTDCPSQGNLQSTSKLTCHHSSISQQGTEQDNLSGRSERYSPVSILEKEKVNEERQLQDDKYRNSIQKGKTMATSTDELTTYSSIEVQTTPYVLSDSESIGLDDEPIENLSLLTKELLNRTELQERIAENINKAILPIEMPSKDESICESLSGEFNTSIMADLNNAIKSIVAATETDPIFEHFLDEIIGPHIDTDTSPDEDPDVRVASAPAIHSRIHEEPPNTTIVDMDLEEEATVIPNKGLSLSMSGTIEVPLKQRLRSSSRQQNNKPEDDADKPREVEKTVSSLEDHNAAAIMSIINANIVGTKPVVEKGSMSGSNALACGRFTMVTQSTELSQPTLVCSESQVADSTEVLENDCVNSKSTEKPITKKPMPPKLKPEPKIDLHQVITEKEIMAMPTLIVCSQEEIRDCFKSNTLYSSGEAIPSAETRFIPIAPKGSEVPEPMKPIYLRTVQVPVQIPRKIQPAITNRKVELTKMQALSPPKMSGTSRKCNRKVTRKPKLLKPDVIPTTAPVDTGFSVISTNESTKNADLESITLYGNDNSFGTMIETGNMPAINLDDSVTLTGTGLSPYLKFHDNKSLSQSSEAPSEKPSNQIPIEEQHGGLKVDAPIVLPHTEKISITKRTPKSLLKSRSKNNRLSMSTPRRRSNHIRALDFNTPIKSSSSEHKLSDNKSLQFSSKSRKRARSVCRTSLFKSPPFSNSFTEKVKTPVKDRQLYEIPIATRSPAPKLMGGWDKYTGVGMILGGTSPHPSTSASISEHNELQSEVKSSLPVVKKSWDADLRQVLQECQESTYSKFSAKIVPTKVKDKAVKNCSTAVEQKILGSESNKCSDQSKQDKSGTSTQGQCVPLSTKLVSGECDNAQIAGFTAQDEPMQSDTSEISKSDGKPKGQAIAEIDHVNKTKDKPVVKKYAKLKTLETKISKYKKIQLIENTASCSVDSSQKKSECLKISLETQHQSAHTSRIIDLETPRKIDSSTGIPPTPRLLSPSSSTITPFTKMAQELSRVPSFISTPDFPPTPSIILTPKVMGENTIDAIKKGEFGTCSPYYQPSTEQLDDVENLISTASNLKESIVEVLPAGTSVNVDTGAVNESGGVVNDFTMTTSSSKLEITQFEVIKDNLPKEEADKELKISANSKNNEETLSRLENSAHSELEHSNRGKNIIERSLNPGESSSSNGNESSDSSSSDTSSSSCSSSCSCSSIATTSTPFKSRNKCKTKSNSNGEVSNDCGSKHVPAITNDYNLLNEISPIVAHEVCTASENNKALGAIQITSFFPRGDSSPVKLLPLIKTQEEADASAKETPAKDEALLSEANISETPSSSKSGIESLTNLNSKISALDSHGDQDIERHTHLVNKDHGQFPMRPAKLKITSVQHFLPDVSVALKPSLVSEVVSSTTRPINDSSTLSSVMLDGKLGSHLEEKRLRLMAKLKNKSGPRIMSQKVKPKQVNVITTNKYKDKHDIKKSSGCEERTCIDQATSQNSVKKVTQVSEKKGLDINNTKIRTKQKSYNPSDGQAKVIESKLIPVKLSSKERQHDKSRITQGAVIKTMNPDQEKCSVIDKKDDCEALIGKKIPGIEGQAVIQKKEEHICNTEISNTNIESQESGDLITKLDPTESGIMQAASSTEVITDQKVISKAADPSHSLKLRSIVSQKSDPTCKKDVLGTITKAEFENAKVLPSCSEDEEYVVGNVGVAVKKSQTVQMSKVDQIKRDLFSDEENSDQRTTRSRTRQLSDAQKNEPVLAVAESASKNENKACLSIAKKPKEELASVLECLKLVPANKNETVEKISTSPKSSINKFAEYEFVYNDSIPIRKKRSKFSSSNLQYVINVELHDENYRECPRLMTSTNYEEIFNISPKPKKRVVAKKLVVKCSKPTKVEALKATVSSTTIIQNELLKSVNPSSQSVKMKMPISKVGKNAARIQPRSLKSTDKDDKEYPKDDNHMFKKRKLPISEEDQSGEKKRRIADPQTLLKKLDLDSFLTSVHGPISH